jgi:hypothetical protein
MTTPPKAEALPDSVRYLSRHVAIDTDKQYVILKAETDVEVTTIPDVLYNWLVATLSVS